MTAHKFLSTRYKCTDKKVRVEETPSTKTKTENVPYFATGSD